jgi:hypothetical protein
MCSELEVFDGEDPDGLSPKYLDDLLGRIDGCGLVLWDCVKVIVSGWSR